MKADLHSSDGYVMRRDEFVTQRTPPNMVGPSVSFPGERPYRRAAAAARQCLACGVVAVVNPLLPCSACGASHFHLIPERRELAAW
jgi:hypothetical protein